MRAVNLLPRDEAKRSFEAKRGVVFGGVAGAALATAVLASMTMSAGGSCVVETEVHPAGASNGAEPVRPGPYNFANAAQATQFVTEAVEALMVLGCDVQAQ